MAPVLAFESKEQSTAIDGVDVSVPLCSCNACYSLNEWT